VSSRNNAPTRLRAALLQTKPAKGQYRRNLSELGEAFAQLAAEGDAALAAGDAGTAARRFDQALGLWRGAALAGFDTVPSARAEAGRLEEQRQALARWMSRLRRAFHAVEKHQKHSERLERQISQMEGS